jgi:4,5-dihydroxyphthalate decarboxylase
MGSVLKHALNLNVGVGDYAHTQALFDGRVALPDIGLHRVSLPVADILSGFLKGAPWEVSEMSMGKFVELTAQGRCDFIGLPIFPYRVFRHAAFYVRADSDLTPERLRHCRIGLPGWSVTAAIYARALVMHQMGIAMNEVEWVVGDIDQAIPTPAVRDLPSGMQVQGSSQSLTSLLLEGKIDAIIAPHAPHVEPSKVRHLFPDHAQQDYAYWQATGIFPIMHVMVLRRAVEQEFPGTAQRLTAAFTAARDSCLQLLRDPAEVVSPLPFMGRHVEWAEQAFGTDFWPYGVEKNRRTLDAFLGFCHEQGVSHRRVDVTELFQGDADRAHVRTTGQASER